MPKLSKTRTGLSYEEFSYHFLQEIPISTLELAEHLDDLWDTPFLPS